jgi:hypothetical protein
VVRPPGHDPRRRGRPPAPWHQTKATPSLQDMLVKLRRVLLAAQYRAGQPAAPTLAETPGVQAAWAAAEPEVRKPSTIQTLL